MYSDMMIYDGMVASVQSQLRAYTRLHRSWRLKICCLIFMNIMFCGIDVLVYWRNWIARLTTNQEVPGSSPG